MSGQKLCILIIDSDPESLNRTTELLHANSMVSKVESVVDSDEALLKLIDSNTDIVLLEYPTKGKAGKELIKFIKTKLAETTIVYVSNTKEHAENAIRNGIFNYLLNPVSKEELGKIIRKVHLVKQTNIKDRINQIIKNNLEETKVRFQTTRGYVIFDPEEILFFKGNGFSTEVYLTNNRVEYINLFLSKLDEILRPFDFVRVSRFYLINQKYIRKLFRGSNIIILVAEGKEYEIKSSKQYIKSLSKYDAE